MNKIIIGAVAGAVIIGGGAFYGGMAYAKGSGGMFGNFTSAERQMRFGANGTGGMMRGGARAGGGFVAGEILSSDASGITIKMQDGSTKIVLMGASTTVMKAASGTRSDLSTGVNVVVTGATNSDGSVTAQSVQIRPAGMTGR